MQLPINEKTKVDNIEDPVVTRLRMEKKYSNQVFIWKMCNEGRVQSKELKYQKWNRHKQEEYKVL